MRISDWSSDVCSSDLCQNAGRSCTDRACSSAIVAAPNRRISRVTLACSTNSADGSQQPSSIVTTDKARRVGPGSPGPGARQSGVEGQGVSGRGGLGGRGNIKKTKQKEIERNE